MYILLEDASWYNRYLVEDEVEGKPPQGDQTPKDEQGGDKKDAESKDGDKRDKGKEKENGSDNPEDQGESTTERSLSDALKDLTPAQFDSLYDRLYEGIKKPEKDDGSIEYLVSKQYRTIGGKLKLNFTKLYNLAQRWIDARYGDTFGEDKGQYSFLVRDGAQDGYSKSSLITYIENAKSVGAKGLGEKLPVSALEVLKKLVDSNDSTTISLINDKGSLLYLLAKQDKVDDPTYVVKAITYLSKPEMKAKLKQAGNFSPYSLLVNKKFPTSLDEIKRRVKKMSDALGKSVSKGGESLTLFDFLSKKGVVTSNKRSLLTGIKKYFLIPDVLPQPTMDALHQVMDSYPQVIDKLLDATVKVDDRGSLSKSVIEEFLSDLVQKLSKQSLFSPYFKKEEEEPPKEEEMTFGEYVSKSKVGWGMWNALVSKYADKGLWATGNGTPEENFVELTKDLQFPKSSFSGDTKAVAKMVADKLEEQAALPKQVDQDDIS